MGWGVCNPSYRHSYVLWTVKTPEIIHEFDVTAVLIQVNENITVVEACAALKVHQKFNSVIGDVSLVFSTL